jgi:hypothetical protein
LDASQGGQTPVDAAPGGQTPLDASTGDQTNRKTREQPGDFDSKKPRSKRENRCTAKN